MNYIRKKYLGRHIFREEKDEASRWDFKREDKFVFTYDKL